MPSLGDEVGSGSDKLLWVGAAPFAGGTHLEIGAMDPTRGLNLTCKKHNPLIGRMLAQHGGRHKILSFK